MDNMVFVDENGRELDPNEVMMLMNREGIIQGEDGLYYEEYDPEDIRNNEDIYKDIITADDYIDDDEEDAARVISNKQKLKDKILHQPSTSNEGSPNKKNGTKV
jgi:hypothetical protein